MECLSLWKILFDLVEDLVYVSDIVFIFLIYAYNLKVWFSTVSHISHVYFLYIPLVYFIFHIPCLFSLESLFYL